MGSFTQISCPSKLVRFIIHLWNPGIDHLNNLADGEFIPLLSLFPPPSQKNTLTTHHAPPFHMLDSSPEIFSDDYDADTSTLAAYDPDRSLSPELEGWSSWSSEEDNGAIDPEVFGEYGPLVEGPLGPIFPRIYPEPTLAQQISFGREIVCPGWDSIDVYEGVYCVFFRVWYWTELIVE